MITHVLDPEAFLSEEAHIEEEAYRHLFRARRLKVGQTLRVVDGRGRARWSEVASVGKRRAALTLGEAAPANEPSFALTLLVAALRPERASWLVEKTTEIGVVALRFLASARSPRSYGRGNLERLRRVATAAVAQCHRSLRPEISGVHPWRDLPGLLGDCEERWRLEPGGRPGIVRTGGAVSGAAIIGPEGGWSRAELEDLERLGVRSAALGPRILRIETAAVASAAKILLPA